MTSKRCAWSASWKVAFLLHDAIGRVVPLAGGKQEAGWKGAGISLLALARMLLLLGGAGCSPRS
jgi:hypothetical protein